MAALGNFAPSGDYAFPYRDLVGARVLVTGGRGTLGAAMVCNVIKGHDIMAQNP